MSATIQRRKRAAAPRVPDFTPVDVPGPAQAWQHWSREEWRGGIRTVTRNVTHLPATQFVSTADLVRDTYALLADLPAEISAVVGIARSGLLPATLIATHRHVPLFAATLEGHITPVGAGMRMQGRHAVNRLVLLVDDTAAHGTAMALTRPWVQTAFPGATVITSVIYSTPQALPRIDYAAVCYPGPHYLEWNFINAGIVANAALDFDGILCEDCPPECDDDADNYADWLATVRPKYLSRRVPVEAIVTARLTKYRRPTLLWLQRWGIECRQLLMGPWKNLEARHRAGSPGRWKAEQYARLPLNLFVESDPVQAAEIAALAQKPVLCPAAGKLFSM